MDYRLRQNRTEAFIRWYAWSLQYGDCDPAVWMTNYLNNRYEHNSEEILWLCWLYGNTYQLPTAWVIKNEFPDFELATFSRIDDWNTKNYKRLRYQTDTKWNKGHLPVMFQSYTNLIGNKTQKEFFDGLMCDNEKKSFDEIWKVVKTHLYKFGRYSTWFYLQHLKHTAGINIEPSSLMLSDNGSKSHRNGLLYAVGEEWKHDTSLTAGEYLRLEYLAKEILVETAERFPELANQIDFFTMETCLCSFRKIFRNNNTRFIGYYLARQKEEIQMAERDRWSGICWDVLWQARKEILDERIEKMVLTKENKSNSTFLSTGKIIDPLEGELITLDNFFT